MSKNELVRFAHNEPPEPGWLDYAEVASGIGVSVRTLQRWIAAGSVPSPAYHGAVARFPLDYVERFNEEGLRLPGTYDRAPSIRAVGKRKSLKRIATKRRSKQKTKTKPIPAGRTRAKDYGKRGAK